MLPVEREPWPGRQRVFYCAGERCLRSRKFSEREDWWECPSCHKRLWKRNRRPKP